jgi:hypothetical protein
MKPSTRAAGSGPASESTQFLTLEEGIPRLREPLEGVNFSSDENIRRPGKLYAKDGRGIARVQVTSGNCSCCSRRGATPVPELKKGYSQIQKWLLTAYG